MFMWRKGKQWMPRRPTETPGAKVALLDSGVWLVDPDPDLSSCWWRKIRKEMPRSRRTRWILRLRYSETDQKIPKHQKRNFLVPVSELWVWVAILYPWGLSDPCCPYRRVGSPCPDQFRPCKRDIFSYPVWFPTTVPNKANRIDDHTDWPRHLWPSPGKCCIRNWLHNHFCSPLWPPWLRLRLRGFRWMWKLKQLLVALVRILVMTSSNGILSLEGINAKLRGIKTLLSGLNNNTWVCLW